MLLKARLACRSTTPSFYSCSTQRHDHVEEETPQEETLFHGKRHPDEMSSVEVGAYLSNLASEAKVSASTQNQALAALLFLYQQVLGRELEWLGDLVHAKRPKQVPVVLGRQEVRDVLARLQGSVWLVCALL